MTANLYVTKVEKVDGTLMNEPIDTYKDVREHLARPEPAQEIAQQSNGASPCPTRHAALPRRPCRQPACARQNCTRRGRRGRASRSQRPISRGSRTRRSATRSSCRRSWASNPSPTASSAAARGTRTSSRASPGSRSSRAGSPFASIRRKAIDGGPAHGLPHRRQARAPARDFRRGVQIPEIGDARRRPR